MKVSAGATVVGATNLPATAPPLATTATVATSRCWRVLDGRQARGPRGLMDDSVSGGTRRHTLGLDHTNVSGDCERARESTDMSMLMHGRGIRSGVCEL